ncbi:Type I phosphodiesterase/nucleotide pyrophosphatase/phosphate transferase [Botryosphaeria dothidea]|uniref:GPI ethanolamine phosphate transferase 2 n=1 Tax=Botryosphaeria dothidea TaxID=55169 RepID=A0A8H4IKT9_9PEZI|nr:Type I phosphodiesterase/nucleotide pyrophosphatase/phosphate transferase [Botryosphaeria dothidea]
MPAPSSLQHALLTVANVLIPVAVLTFAVGFFPYKPFLPGLAQYGPSVDGNSPEAPFDKVVFMVVDALRSDFVFSNTSGFKYTQGLISSGAALPFTAHATSPTITMPRVKAITTGSIPSFLDVILNFAESDITSTLAYQDTWLAQLKAKEGGKLVMYGDDTWLKLFPETFERADGTSSFFVSDFTEVDNNVTRHVPNELRNSDWNAMIMHYLGLDHIGHKAGPLSPNMIPKQIEMDEIVKQIYEAIETQPHLRSTLFILCGDHGMNDGGNHGGSAPGETSPALVFMSPKLKKISKGLPCPTLPSQEFDYYTKVEQSDIAPTLAGLLGFPVPLNNLGVFIPDFLPLWSNVNDRAQLVLRNAHQILEIVTATFPSASFHDLSFLSKCDSPSSTSDELVCKWLKVMRYIEEERGKAPKAEDIINSTLAFCQAAQEALSSTASNYDVTLLIVGAMLATASTAIAISVIAPSFFPVTATGIFSAIVTVLYGIMMFASSYVEEEQHFWYWSTSAWFALLFVLKARKTNVPRVIPPIAALLLCHRVTRRWNQTGQKFAGAPDIVHSVAMTHPVVLWSLVSITYLHLTMRIKTHLTRRFATTSQGRQLQTFAVGNAFLLCSVAFLFKLSFTARDAPELVRGASPAAMAFLEGLNLVKLTRCVFIGSAVGVGWVVLRESAEGKGRSGGLIVDALHDFLALVLLTQTRASNIPLFLLFRVQQHFLAQLNPTPAQHTLTALLLAHSSFFALGNSNAISSIDLSNAYNGIGGYNIVAVGVLLFVSNWAGPIYWTSASVLGLLDATRWSRGSQALRRVMQEKERQKWAEVKRSPETGKVAVATEPGTLPRLKGMMNQVADIEDVEGMWFRHFARLTVWMGAAVLSVMVACAVLRTHLFIWTVFSPKYLYAMAWAVGFHLVVSGLFGWAIWKVGV